MTTQDENRDVIQSNAFDPFPEPQTIPSGWDLSELLYAPEPFDLAQGRPAPSKQEDDSTES